MCPLAYAPLELGFRPEHFPFWTGGKIGTAKEVCFLFPHSKVRLKVAAVSDPKEGTDPQDELAAMLFGTLQGGALKDVPCPGLPKFVAYLSDNSMEELWLVVRVSWT